MNKYKEGKMYKSSLSDFPTISFSRKSNAWSFPTNKGEKEKCHCIVLSVLEPLSGKNYNENIISDSVEPRME